MSNFGYLVFWRCSNYRYSRWLSCAIVEMFFLVVYRSKRVYCDILYVPGRISKEIEDRNPVTTVRSSERVLDQVKIFDVGDASKTRQLSWIM